MRIYLDVSCLNRPFDDQEQPRIRLEAAAVGMIIEGCDEGRWTHVSSEVAMIEIDANPSDRRRSRVRLLLPEPENIVKLTAQIFARAGSRAKPKELAGRGGRCDQRWMKSTDKVWRHFGSASVVPE